MSVITIFSPGFSAAVEVGRRVAEQLGYSEAGEAIITSVAERSGLSTATVARTMRGDRGFFDALTHEFDKSLVYLRAALAELLNTDEQVITGPAVLLVPSSIRHVLRVELFAEHQQRVEACMLEEGVNAGEAEQRIETADQEVRKWQEELSQRGFWDPSRTDVRLSSTRDSMDAAVATICENAQKPALTATEASIQAVLDFQLAARVHVALLEKGHLHCEVRAEGGAVEVVATRQPGPGKLSRSLAALRWDRLAQDVESLAEDFPEARGLRARPGAPTDLPLRTLLVDDEEEYVTTLSDRLGMRDIPTTVALDGEQALTYVATDRPDVMVLDLRMPGMDGMEVLRRLKSDHPTVQVIIVTGHGDAEDERTATELGAFAYLHKPVDIQVLAETIKRASQAAAETTSGREKADEEGEA